MLIPKAYRSNWRHGVGESRVDIASTTWTGTSKAFVSDVRVGLVFLPCIDAE